LPLAKIIGGVLTLTLVLLCGCAVHVAADAPDLLQPVGVQNDVFVVERGRIARIEQYQATVRVESEGLFFRDAPLPFGGFEVLVGQEVRAGDVLARLDTRRIEERLDLRRERIADLQQEHRFADGQMERAISAAQIELLDLTMRLTEADGLPTEEMLEAADMKRLHIQRLQLDLQQAQDWQAFNLSYYQSDLNDILAQLAAAELRAPFDGVVTFRADLRQGGWVEAFRPLVYISDGQNLFIEHTGRSSPTIFQGSRKYAHIGGAVHEVERIIIPPNEALVFTRAGGTVPLRFAFVGEASGVEAGQFVQLKVYTDVVEDVLRIPPNALFFDEEFGAYVNLTDGAQPVVTGLRNPAWVEVVSGLAEGDEIIVQQ